MSNERFAPSPTGLLHLGHAYSALLAHKAARDVGGKFLLRIEDIDTNRSKPEFEQAIYDDLRWLGITWDSTPLRQSDRMPFYSAALKMLSERGLTYACTCTRTDIKNALSAPQEGSQIGFDGPVYPGTCRHKNLPNQGAAIRLNMSKAIQEISHMNWEWIDLISGREVITPEYLADTCGDIVLARKDIGVSYHLAVVIDDAAQKITTVTRGEDMKGATPIHIVLQALLGFQTPLYRHHGLIRDDNGKRLAKRDDAKSIAKYRSNGLSPDDVRDLIGL